MTAPRRHCFQFTVRTLFVAVVVFVGLATMLARNFGLPAATFAQFPKRDVFIASGRP